MKKLVYTILAFVIIAIAVYLYATRAVKVTEIPFNFVDTSTVATSTTVITIDSSKTIAQYQIGEILRGSPFTVVGNNTSIEGSVVFDNDIVSGEVRIDARVFKTDAQNRDNAVARYIFKSEDPRYTHIVFKPTQVTNLQTSLSQSTSHTFTVQGDLTIVDVTKPVSFAVTVTNTNGVFTGEASTTISRKDFNISIPSVPFVASADDEVKLKLMFVSK